MIPSSPLTTTRVAIVGLGLMGGSLALALRGQCAALYAADPDPATQTLAQAQGMVDILCADATELPPADLIILATPVRTILRLLQLLPQWHPAPAVVLDLGSTKTAVTQAMATLPASYDPLGGHPMCGKEVGSLANADAQLYQNAPFAFTPLPRTTPRARQLVKALATAVGARPLWLDAETHDRWTAVTSHAPYLIARALAAAAPAEVAPLIGPGFRSSTRIAATPPGMMLDILLTNRANVLHALAAFRAQLDRLEKALATADEATLLGR